MDTNRKNKIKIKGELKARKLESIRSKLLPYTDSDLSLDLSEITEFDTSSLQFLLSIQKELESKGNKLAVVSSSESVERIVKFYNKDFLLNHIPETTSKE
ncbi:anti-sigma factor antagonist [Leptospira koniambonensis]|uniref:Anti-sigma factor antagonist n=1 Tax=Leptospira koniambonensis TaxID=2484950 RepID=A0A4V3JN37_9LEPT|nr:STAS domain-containing protein [Leptospira koniambonensis]TGL32585.1 anti-sigma factor antagonist [Leptospira koniambonensis]